MNAGYLGKSLLFRFSFLQAVAVRTFRSGMRTEAVHTEKIGSAFASAFVKPVFAILFLKVGIRTGRVRRGVVVIKIRLVDDLINIIQNHVGMNCSKQFISVYVQQIKSIRFTQDYSEGSLIYNFRMKMQGIPLILRPAA